ncbi:toxin-antitoxin system YwqK family antitoxin [Fusobacterium pseudoperiodonticum]|uniref:toxin-antitoxin system YwqK family antitoxin n=1 Tax=Fusobacterium pseudoperiodonticum TaxID=2663009 RepID=UPI0028EF39FC|nr:toxin-antitoxin system YwqK family antitoxin [Fusobacterium pseudoperiodonticum]
MKKILIVLTFIFISLLSFADNTNVGVRIPLGEEKVELDPSIKMLMGLTKVENDPKYKKLVNYVDDNLAKKGIVKYYGAINLKKGAMEVFSENGTLLDEEKLPDEFMTMVSLPLNFEEGKEKEKVKKMLKEAYENPTYVTISKNNGKPKIYIEKSMGPAEEKIKIIDEVILKRELTEAEKKELLSLENDKLIEKYKSYIESEISKGYQNNKVVMAKEFKNLTETAVMYDKDNNSMKMEIKYKDNSLENGIARSYTNNKLTQEMFFENSTATLLRKYHDNGNLAIEFPANGEAKIYYENGKVKESVPVKNGKREGIGREYDETGKVIKETLYRNDKEIKKSKKAK